uniref:Cytochrome P450 CYP707-1a n=1 Tax=Daphne genkwa TaxID=1477590 RepID=A0A977LHB3_9ROSI|nr:cytochrome P450 CYP707-1a [Daphne genkwa]
MFSVLLPLLLTAALLLLPRLLHNRRHPTAGAPPGSCGPPLIGETIQFLAAANSTSGFYDFVRIRRLRHGKWFKTSVFGETHVFLSSTESARAILTNGSGKFTKKYIKSIAALVGDRSLLCASPQHHRLLRARLLSFFSSNSLASFIKHFDHLIITTLNSWQDGTVVLLDEALKITLRAMCKMLLSLEEGDEIVQLEGAVAQICEAMLAFPLNLPTTRFCKGLQARQRITGTLDKVISDRRRGIGAKQEDFLHHLMACHAGLNRLTDAEIKDNILTMIIAGQDTTASAITWMVKYLSENQEVLEKLKVEQLQLANKTPKGALLTFEDFNEMLYASKVVKESLRMASVVPWLPRLVLQDCELEGYMIKKGWNVNIDARSVHLDPNIYDDPHRFDPSRFEVSRPYSFLAFGMGGRTCLGMNMAKAMMLVFLHRLVTTYK